MKQESLINTFLKNREKEPKRGKLNTHTEQMTESRVELSPPRQARNNLPVHCILGAVFKGYFVVRFCYAE